MKKTLMAIVATQLLVAGIASASELKESRQITISAPKKDLACGIDVPFKSAELGLPFFYFVKRNDESLIPFVDITEWKTGKNHLNPDKTILHNIGYRLGTHGVPIYRFDENFTANEQFRLDERPEQTLFSNEKNTELEMTVTCLTKGTEEFKRAMAPFNGKLHPAAIRSAVWAHNKKTTYDGNSISTPIESGRPIGTINRSELDGKDTDNNEKKDPNQ